MFEPSLKMYLILCPMIFLASFVDAVAGGGGVISLPAYLFIGLPAHYAAGSNKFSACLGTVSASTKYLRSKSVNLRASVFAAVCSLIGAVVGAKFALFLSERSLKITMLVALPCVAIIMILRGNKLTRPQPKNYTAQRVSLISIFIGLIVGFYDGIIGPGTGTFLILAFSALLGYDLLLSSGCAKISNLASNLGSLCVYLLNGKVMFSLAVPAAVCSIIGGYAGARFAVKGGSKNIKYIMFVVLGMLFIKFAVELF